MKINVCVLFLLFCGAIDACECPELKPISKMLTNNYNVIFAGTVDSVSKNTERGFKTVYFLIKELYKGNVEQRVKINFDATTSCMMSFAKKEEWLIYANYKKFDYLTVSICEHSRKHFNEGELDFYQATAQRSFAEEQEFLKADLGTHPFIKSNELEKQQEQFKPHNIQPEPLNKLLLLFISVISMMIIIFVTRKKNN